jgi:hypothetical protein
VVVLEERFYFLVRGWLAGGSIVREKGRVRKGGRE